MLLLVLLLSIWLTGKICNFLFKNTIGTTQAYIGRMFGVWIIVIGVLASIVGYLGLI